MNGIEFAPGTRYDISPLDVAILADTGVLVEIPNTPIPEPHLVGLVAFVVTAAGAVRRRNARRTPQPC
jgi:hypothetical protein